MRNVNCSSGVQQQGPPPERTRWAPEVWFYCFQTIKSSFHQQVLLYRKLLYNHNFTPHRTPIWNNRFILFRYKSLCILDWLEKGVWSVLHLMNEDGRLLSFSDFCSKYILRCERKQFERVLNAIPKSLINLVQNTFVNIPGGSCELLSLLFNGKDLKAMHPNKLIRSCFNSVLYPTSLCQNGILQAYDKPTIKK